MRILAIHNAYKQFGREDTVVSQEIEAYKKLGHHIPISLKRKPKGNSYSSTLVYLERKMPINKFTTKILNGISEVIKISSKTKSPELDPGLTQELLDIYREPFNKLYNWLEKNGSNGNKTIKKVKKSWKL